MPRARQQQVSSKGCSRAFIFFVLIRALDYAKGTVTEHKRVSYPFPATIVLTWLKLAKIDCAKFSNRDALFYLLGGVTPFCASDSSTYWSKPQQFFTWWKNNVERVQKFTHLLQDSLPYYTYFPTTQLQTFEAGHAQSYLSQDRGLAPCSTQVLQLSSADELLCLQRAYFCKTALALALGIKRHFYVQPQKFFNKYIPFCYFQLESQSESLATREDMLSPSSQIPGLGTDADNGDMSDGSSATAAVSSGGATTDTTVRLQQSDAERKTRGSRADTTETETDNDYAAAVTGWSAALQTFAPSMALKVARPTHGSSACCGSPEDKSVSEPGFCSDGKKRKRADGDAISNVNNKAFITTAAGNTQVAASALGPASDYFRDIFEIPLLVRAHPCFSICTGSASTNTSAVGNAVGASVPLSAMAEMAQQQHQHQHQHQQQDLHEYGTDHLYRYATPAAVLQAIQVCNRCITSCANGTGAVDAAASWQHDENSSCSVETLTAQYDASVDTDASLYIANSSIGNSNSSSDSSSDSGGTSIGANGQLQLSAAVQAMFANNQYYQCSRSAEHKQSK